MAQYTKSIGLLALAAFAFFPILVPLFICETTDCSGLNEGNSTLASLPWLIFITVPAAVAILLAYFVGALAGHLIAKFFNRPP